MPAAAPLLTDDLVIAARDRAREPELPEATVARALSTPISPRLARYDVIVVGAGIIGGESLADACPFGHVRDDHLEQIVVGAADMRRLDDLRQRVDQHAIEAGLDAA